jgi:hypothetical protein
MEVVVLVPICGGISVKIDKDPSNPRRFDVWPPIYHPAVDFFLQKIIVADGENPVDLLLEDQMLSIPLNIDAAIFFRRNREKFDQRNKKLQEQTYEECVCCMEKPDRVRFMCPNLHWICRSCYEKDNRRTYCYLCRWN